jgi:hypothetical protein
MLTEVGINDFPLVRPPKSWMPTPAFARGMLFVSMMG